MKLQAKVVEHKLNAEFLERLSEETTDPEEKESLKKQAEDLKKQAAISELVRLGVGLLRLLRMKPKEQIS